MDFELKQIKTSQPFLGFIESRQGGRPENQDSCGFADTLLGLLVVVCDGMGGGPGGKMASMVAVDIIVQTVRSATADSDRVKTIEAAVQNAHLKLLSLQKEKTSLIGMGTTATILLINKRSAVIAHVGDSRIYQLRWGNKIFRTDDHSLVGEMVRKKAMTEDEARMSPNSNIIQRALGVGENVKADICERPYEKNDRFALCTDGVWGTMKEKELVEMLARTKTLSGAMEKTMVKVDEIGMAEGNRHDNFTMALLMTTCNSTLKETMTTKTRNVLIGLAVVCGLSLIGNGMQFATPQETESDSSSVATIKELKRQMAEKDVWMTKMEKQIRTLKQKNDSTFDMLKTIESTSKEVAEIVKENNVEEQKKTERLVKELEKLINQLKEICDMPKGEVKDGKIAEVRQNILNMSPKLLPYGVRIEQVEKVRELLGNKIASSDKEDEKYRKNDMYKGHWTSTNNPKGIITLMKEIMKEIKEEIKEQIK